MRNSEASVYVVDDDVSAREAMVGLARAAGLNATGFTSARDFLAHPRPGPGGCLVLDVDLPDLNGLELQRRLSAARDALPIIFVTGHGSVPMSVTALKAGAVDFLTKPFDADALLEAIERALAQGGRDRGDRTVAGIVGTSKALRAALRKIETVAATDATVLIMGETGTGKECLARALHELSARRQGPFVKVNCAAIPANLLESELLGHEKGAFTGAAARRIGRFELAHEGTLFLDEIGELPLELQPKLLRVLQEHEFERIGGARTVRSNARVVVATNRNLKAMVAERLFREDLFYRLNVVPIVAPPLRDRKEDIPLLARHFANALAHRLGRPVKEPSSELLERLVRYRWPGNVRELQNVLERAAIMAPAAADSDDDFDLDAPDPEPAEASSPGRAPPPHPSAPVADGFDVAAFIREQLTGSPAGGVFAQTHRRVDRILFKMALDHTRGNQGEAARIMGISRQTMHTRLRTLGITVSRSVEEADDEATASVRMAAYSS